MKAQFNVNHIMFIKFRNNNNPIPISYNLLEIYYEGIPKSRSRSVLLHAK